MRFLVFQHDKEEHPGKFRALWHKDGIEWTTIELDQGDAIPVADFDEFDALIVMGGHQHVWQEDLYPWLKAEKEAIRHWVVDLGRPYLGICLGHQLLAEALGGHVAKMNHAPEIAVGSVSLTEAGRDDPLFETIGRTFDSLHWHAAEVTHLPEGAEILAYNTTSSVQAMRWGRHAYGLQCHPEIVIESVLTWIEDPACRKSIDGIAPGLAELLFDTAFRALPSFTKTAQSLHHNFLALLPPSPVSSVALAASLRAPSVDGSKQYGLF